MDELQAVRERGICLRIPLNQFETKTQHVTIVDGPRHRNFIKNMITDASQIDCVLLVVSAGLNGFKVDVSKDGQTREHALFMYTLGVKQMIVIVNKMDTTDPPFSQVRFNEIKSELLTYIEEIGYQPESIAFIPASALYSDNMIDPSVNMSWYKGWTVERKEGSVTGKTLVEAIDAIIPPQHPSEKPLRLPIQDVYTISDTVTVAVGRIEAGILKTNMKITFTPSNLSTEVKSIEMYHERMDEALPGDNIGFGVQDVSARKLHRGFVCSDSNNDPAQEASSLIAQIIVLNHPGKISQGYTPTLDCHTAHIACKFAELISKIGLQTGNAIEDAPKFVKSGDCAIVKLIPTKPMCVEKFADYPSLGRFIVRDMRQTVAVGIIKDVEKRTPNRTLDNYISCSSH
ncbi:unnamed protein product [Rotaria sp. Silwood2]|nr:unnamed protein product [Rotaria sp. Silwood2]CAF4434006.1 unnamed protein product [Rotaria sp. Silwood2]